MAARRILGRLGIICGRRVAPGAANRLGFSVRKPLPMPWSGATPEEQAEFIKNTKGTIARWREGAAPHWPSTRPRYGAAHVRQGAPAAGREGCRPHRPFKKSIRLIGARGGGTPDLQFHVDLKADGYAAPEYARRRHTKICLIIPQLRGPRR